MILDSSGSMEGSMGGVISAASSLIDMLDRYDEAEIIDFDSRVKMIHEFSDDQESLRGVLGSVTVGGSTALYDSISKGIRDVQERDGMKALVLLTDGKDENAKGERQSRTTFGELKELLESSNVPVYMIGLGSGVDKNVLDTIAGLSRGTAYYAAETDAVKKIYEDILSYLHSLHRIYYVSKHGAHDGSRRDVEIKIKDTRVKASTSYLAPKSKYWSYCYKPFDGEDGYNALGLANRLYYRKLE